VKIDLDAQLFRWRQRVVEAGHVTARKRLSMKVMALVLAQPRLFRAAGLLMRRVLRVLPYPVARLVAGPWGESRELPVAPKQSFHAWYRANRGGPR
jgi:L-lactate dehydrogenase complex protein LldF